MMDDLISRQEAIEALQEHRNLFCDNTPETFSKLSYAEKSRVDELDMAIATLINLPSAQPDSKETSPTHKALDTISRQDAIRIVDGIDTWQAGWRGNAIESMKALPSAQPETHEERTETHACDLISRQAAMEEISKQQTYKMFEGEDTLYLDANDVGSVLASLPPAQPEHTNSCYTNSWCIDCKEYDTEKHSCPRFNRVIKQTLDEIYSHAETEAEARYHAQQRWIPFKTRPLTEEEKEEHPEWDRILDCKLPDDGQAILISVNLRGHESVQYDEFYTDDGSYLDSGYEIGDEAVAWMPLPEPYAERKTDEKENI